MIAQILPPSIASAHTWGDSAGQPYAEEQAAVESAVEQRRREYATVRHCARQALAALGHPPVPLVPAADRSPRWPDGIVGSMTHCDGYRAAAVARASEAMAVGIDAEPNEPLPDGLLRLIAVPAEIARLDALARAHPGVSWDRLTFSAKESVYKAWYPLMDRWLGFDDAALTVDPAGRTFVATLRAPLVLDDRPCTQLTGRWTVSRGVLATSVVIVRAPNRSPSRRLPPQLDMPRRAGPAATDKTPAAGRTGAAGRSH